MERGVNLSSPQLFYQLKQLYYLLDVLISLKSSRLRKGYCSLYCRKEKRKTKIAFTKNLKKNQNLTLKKSKILSVYFHNKQTN